jgi:hypothetical protein
MTGNTCHTGIINQVCSCSGTNNSVDKAQNFKEGAFRIPRNFFILVEHYLKQVQADDYSIKG